MPNKKLIWTLILSSLILSYMTFKTDFDHKKELEEQTKISFNIGCVVGTESLLAQWTPDPEIFQLYCYDLANAVEMKQLMDFIEKLKANVGPIEE
jgi:hypothetical protein